MLCITTFPNVFKNSSFVFALQIKVIAIIAEGIPENMTRKMIKIADAKGVTIIGPATVCIFFFTLFYFNLVSVKNKKMCLNFADSFPF